MLEVNMMDVKTVLQSATPYLVAIGVALVLALVITFAVNKNTVKQTAARKLVHSESWLVALVAIIVAVVMMLYGPFSTLLTNASQKTYALSDSTIEQAEELATDVYRESVTLLENEDDNLPMSDTKVNVFGWASTNPVYGGTGSGSLNGTYETTSLLDGFAQAGLETNSELSQLYTDYRSDRPEVGMNTQDWTLPEVPANQYSDEIIANAKEFSDQAVIVISRVGGEGADLPMNMKADGITYTNNSTEYEDFEEGEHFLELSQTEEDLIKLVTENFENVTLVYNGANAFELDFVEDYPQIKSVLWCPPAGQTGFIALGEALTGETNPSGKTSDTFAVDFTQSPSFNNLGDFDYDNMSEFTGNSADTGQDTTPTFVNYVEGIYVGYKYYETAADEGFIDYEDQVLYPFGYGMSYTTFSQEMGEVTYGSDGTISFDVTVTNTGDTAGKDVVEVYYNPPYTNGGIEKATANLVEFEKTDELEPGESQTVTIEFTDEDMASYDYEDEKAYVLEEGDYEIAIKSDSHTVIDEQTVNVPETIVYDEDNPRSTDETAATNAFDDAHGNYETLSRADGFANYETATAAPSDYSMPEEDKAKFTNIQNYDPESHDNDDDEMPTTGADNGVRLADLRGKDYDDELWDDLLDQLTFDEMDNLIANAGYGTAEIESIGKVKMNDVDGPASLNSNFTGSGSIGFPASVAFACTWNADLAHEFGLMIGQMAQEIDCDGWYAPAMNIHRSTFSGRNYEYFSEDGYLSGVMAAQEIAGAKEQGVYSYMKHFALNDQETNRHSMLCTWADEQTIREIYLKSFEMAVKDGGAQAAMSSYNYIGTTWSGANSSLLQTVLRGEWGFQGHVLTDFFNGLGYMYGDQAIRNGNDAMLAPMESTNHITDKSATSVKAMRTAVHNILYTSVSGWRYADGEPKSEMPLWKTITWASVGVLAVAIVGLEVLTVMRYLRRRKTVVTVTPAEGGDA
ncbi:glycoside hydrolase family 3 N-terminal domain-containing protein [Bifidobacterium oedipodis]|uniref:Beta-glucosidase-related glycosidase n=1 Tax=Bifidobacterium oedipodis TaxID=2675322 RepID=A0A7Y0HU61_9BIFI|nr:glycoside hydrolase family 3 N-terminal domain-containing protein [Bifidobacterium sp. DSM 109957]NMM94832.1 beta-glucosidase-related glycosidase [Bifidobacterium sp. DSM 109957]